jgi:uncharacterized protein (TIGR03437 family)
MKSASLLILLAAACAIQAQTWDTSGNSKLKGQYYFRQVIYGESDKYGDLESEEILYGNITFDGNGNYAITGLYYFNGLSSGIPSSSGAVNTTGTYSIAASGYGFIGNPCFSFSSNTTITCPVPPVPIYGLVSAQGVFIGSITEGNGDNNIMVAAPVTSPAPTASSFTGSWTCAAFDPTVGVPNYMLSFMFTLNPDGNGNLNAEEISGYEGTPATSPIKQTVNGLTYTFSNGVATATFPAGPTLPVGNGLISGQKYLYFSPDGNFLFGGSPDSYDMIVGVKTSAGTPALSGLYYQAGFDQTGGSLESWFGSLDIIPGAAPQTVLGHRRMGSGSRSATDNTYSETISLSGNTFSDTEANYVVGDGGAVIISSGIGPNLGIIVALQAPTPTGTGVFLNPTGVVNAASNAPFTARIAPGELLTLYGSNLASSTQIAGTPFPTTGLGDVHVTIGGYPAAIYYVSPSQISAIVPYEVTPGSIVSIQVTNDMGSSNVVTNYVANTAPGVFTQNQNGTGYGAIVHLGIGNSVAPIGSVVSDANPAMQGETVSVYLTGLGAVSPAISDGGAGPSSPLSWTTNTIGVAFSGTAGTNDFAGLAPGYSGLYQLNVTVPTGLTAGPNFLDISGPDSSMSYLLIPVAAAAGSGTANVRTAATLGK